MSWAERHGGVNQSWSWGHGGLEEDEFGIVFFDGGIVASWNMGAGHLGDPEKKASGWTGGRRSDGASVVDGDRV